MSRPVALRQRAQFAALLTRILHTARQAPAWHEPDRRHLRLWRQLLLAVLVHRSTRFAQRAPALAHALLPLRRGTTIKTVAQGIGAFLRSRHAPVEIGRSRLLAATLTQLDPSRLLRAHGRVLLVIDATEYPKRSRGRGTQGRQMQHLGRVRNAHGKVSGTPYGYVDLWAGLVLKGKRVLPLARQLFSSTHPSALSQNQVEEAVLEAALTSAAHVPWPALVVADRGFGRKALLIRLAQRRLALVIRIDPDILVQARGMAKEALLAPVLAEQPWLGSVIWDRGAEGKLPGRVRALRAHLCQAQRPSRGDPGRHAQRCGVGAAASAHRPPGRGDESAGAECRGGAENRPHLCAALGD